MHKAATSLLLAGTSAILALPLQVTLFAFRQGGCATPALETVGVAPLLAPVALKHRPVVVLVVRLMAHTVQLLLLATLTLDDGLGQQLGDNAVGRRRSSGLAHLADGLPPGQRGAAHRAHRMAVGEPTESLLNTRTMSPFRSLVSVVLESKQRKQQGSNVLAAVMRCCLAGDAATG